MHPVRVYLLKCTVDATGEPIVPARATMAPDYAFLRENKRATRRMSGLLYKASRLAAQVNTGELSFESAAAKFQPSYTR